ncbi:NAD(P)-binding protein [Hesseltinella vesiculosa]|uniref:NAD(P)-binding protein n=1 Tax=Hesseltinella vesiculosa TaxID=101127 RepID=A0A1X2G5Y5_9FUNG|nr:NAD(P)-binding protein [Hesseltinella vesiculosa]
MVSNKKVLFQKIPTAYPVIGEHIAVEHSEFNLDAPLLSGEFILKTLVLSVDPYMRGRMRDVSIESYAPAFVVGQPIDGYAVAIVEKSNSSVYKVGDYLYGMGDFVNYAKMSEAEAKARGMEVRPDIPTSGLPITNYVGVLGMPGATAYFGLEQVGKPKAGETIYISAASGAVGQLVGQLAKTQGLRVVGSAGSDEKVAHLKNTGFDAAFNYKTEDTDAKLTEYCPDGVDIYFDNVGGVMLETTINHMNNYGRIVACGAISQYNTSFEESYGVRNLVQMVGKRLRFEGYIILDHPDFDGPFRERMAKILLDGKFKYLEDVVDGIENAPEALLDVLHGKNFGKKVVHVADA